MPRLPYFPTFSTSSKRREVFALPSLFPCIYCWLQKREKSSPCLPYFPIFSAGPERKESLRLAFPISLHLVLNLNVGKVFALFTLFPYI